MKGFDMGCLHSVVYLEHAWGVDDPSWYLGPTVLQLSPREVAACYLIAM